MNTKKRLFGSGLLIALAAAGILISGDHNVAKAGPGAAPVLVTNTPLPVQGTVVATQSGPWNVGISGTPTVNVGAMPAVSLNGTPTVNVGSMPAVSLAGTPTVNANVTFPASQAVTVAAAGPLTNVGRLPSKHVMLISAGPGECPTLWFQVGSAGLGGCFDMANHPGEVLVITDYSWVGTTNPGATCLMELVPLHIGSSYFQSTAVGASDGFAGKSEHFTTGLPLTLNPQFFAATGAAVSSCNYFGGTITGYLMPNQ